MKISTRGFLFQAIHTIFSKGYLLVIGILTGIITARVLKPDGKGLVAMFQVLPGMVVAFSELGIRQSTAYLIGQKRFNEGDIQANMIALYCISAISSFFIICWGYWSLGMFKYGLLMSIVFALISPIALLEKYSSGLLLGRKLIEKINYIQIIQSSAGLILITLFVGWFGWDVMGAGIGLLLAQCIAIVLLLSWISKYASLKPKLDLPILKEMLKKGISFALSLFMISLNYRVDLLMLGKIQSNADAGIYIVGVNICELLKQIPLAIGLVLYSHSTSWTTDEINEALNKTAFLTRIIVFLSFTMALILASVVWWLIPLFYGVSFQESSRIVWYLLPGIVVLTYFISTHLFVAGQGKPELALYAFAPASVLNIVLNILLIKKWSYIGAAMSSTISYIFAVIIYLVVFRNQFRIRISDFIYPKKKDFSFLWNRVKGYD